METYCGRHQEDLHGSGHDRMRPFVDLGIRPPAEERAAQERMAALAYQAGLSLVGLRFTYETQASKIESSAKIFHDAGPDVAIGVEISPTSRKQLLSQLRVLRERFDFVAVRSMDTRTLAVASRDSRVDLISLEPQKSFRVKQSILKTCKSALELELSRVLRSPHDATYESLRAFSFEIEMAKRIHADIVLSSGATEPLALRAPRDMASVAVSLGLPLDTALDSVSTMPLSLIKRNREQLSGQWLRKQLE